MPGVGPRTLTAELPELGTLNHEQMAALVGVAPRSRDSGKFRRNHMIWGGRAPIRSALYLSVWSAARWNPAILMIRQGDAGTAPEDAHRFGHLVVAENRLHEVERLAPTRRRVRLPRAAAPPTVAARPR